MVTSFWLAWVLVVLQCYLEPVELRGHRPMVWSILHPCGSVGPDVTPHTERAGVPDFAMGHPSLVNGAYWKFIQGGSVGRRRYAPYKKVGVLRPSRHGVWIVRWLWPHPALSRECRKFRSLIPRCQQIGNRHRCQSELSPPAFRPTWADWPNPVHKTPSKMNTIPYIRKNKRRDHLV